MPCSHPRLDDVGLEDAGQLGDGLRIAELAKSTHGSHEYTQLVVGVFSQMAPQGSAGLGITGMAPGLAGLLPFACGCGGQIGVDRGGSQVVERALGPLGHDRVGIGRGLPKRLDGAWVPAGSEGENGGIADLRRRMGHRLKQGWDRFLFAQDRQPLGGRDPRFGRAFAHIAESERHVFAAAADGPGSSEQVDGGRFAEAVQLQVQDAAIGPIVGPEAVGFALAQQGQGGRVGGTHAHGGRRRTGRGVTADARPELARSDIDPAHLADHRSAFAIHRLQRHRPVRRDLRVEGAILGDRHGAQLHAFRADMHVDAFGGHDAEWASLVYADRPDAAGIGPLLLGVAHVLAVEEPSLRSPLPRIMPDQTRAGHGSGACPEVLHSVYLVGHESRRR